MNHLETGRGLCQWFDCGLVSVELMFSRHCVVVSQHLVAASLAPPTDSGVFCQTAGALTREEE